MTIASPDITQDSNPSLSTTPSGKRWLTHRRCLAILGVAVLLITVGNALWLREDRTPPAWDAARYLVNSLEAFDMLRRAPLTSLKELYFVHNTVRPSIGQVLPTMPFYLLFGTSEDVATLWTHALFLLVIAYSVYGIGRRLFDVRVGLLAALLIILNPEIISMSRIYRAELGVTAFASLVVYLLIRSDFLKHKAFVVLAGVALGAGLMQRPIFPLVFVAGPLLFVFVGSLFVDTKTADESFAQRLLHRCLPGLVLFALPVLLVALPFYWRYGKQMLGFIVFYQEAGTFAPVQNVVSMTSFLWYATNFYASVSWVFHLLFLVAVVVYLLALMRRLVALRSAVLLAWIIVPYAILSLTATKRFDYLSALYPALALLLAFAVLFVFRRSRTAQLAASLVVLGLALLVYWQVSWAQPLPNPLANRLAMYASTPDREHWPDDDIIRLIRRIAPADEPVTLGVVSAVPNLAEPSLAYYARRHAPHITVIRWTDPIPTLIDADFVVVKTGVIAEDPPRTIEDRNATLVRRTLQQPASVFFTTHKQVGQFALPDGSRAVIYQRLVPASSEEMQKITQELAAAAEAMGQSAGAPIEIDRATLRDRVQLGKQLLSEGRYAEALPIFQQVVDADPSITDAQQGLGRTMFALGNCAGAIEHYGEAVQRLSINGTYTVFGDILLACERVDEAIAAYEKGIELDPQEVRTHFVLAQAYMAQGRTADALREFDRTIELDAKQEFVDRAQRFLQQLATAGSAPATASTPAAASTPAVVSAPAAQSAAAQPAFDRAALRSQVDRGNSLYAEGRYAEALPIFQQVVDAEPTIADAQQGLARTLFVLGDCDGAARHQAEAVKLLSINGTYTVFGDMLLECGRVDEAIAAYQQGIELDPQEVRTHFVLAHAYMAKGRNDEAIREFNRTIELDAKQEFVERARRFLQQLQTP